MNKYYDEKKPWVEFKENIKKFNDIIYTCTVAIANISILIEPFMPNVSNKIKEYLKIDNNKWEFIYNINQSSLENIQPLFEKM